MGGNPKRVAPDQDVPLDVPLYPQPATSFERSRPHSAARRDGENGGYARASERRAMPQPYLVGSGAPGFGSALLGDSTPSTLTSKNNVLPASG
jgi:hypothetical protein